MEEFKLRRILITLTLCLVLVGMIATPVMAAPKAGAVRTPLYPVDGGSSNNVRDDLPSQGKVIVNTPDGNVTLIFNGIVKGLEANHFYTVWVRDIDPGYTGDSYNSYVPLGYYLIGHFTTDEYGAGNFHINVRAADLAAAQYGIQVAINDTPNFPTIIGITVLATEKYTDVTTGHQ